MARNEYNNILRHLDQATVEPVDIVAGRLTRNGESLNACVLTRHLEFSLPYRAVRSQTLCLDALIQLIDALAVLLIRLHFTNAWWGR